MVTKTIEEFAERKMALIKCLQKTNDLITYYEKFEKNLSQNDEMMKSLQEIINDLIFKVQNDVFKVMIVGEFSTGKSTFLNALLGEDILPMAVRPTTATINLIKYNENKSADIHFFGERDENGKEITDGKTENIPLSELKDYTTSLTKESNEKSKEVKIVQVYYPSEYCNNGVEVLDTPGLNSTNGHHERATIEYLPNGNVGIMLFSAIQFLTKSESNYLKTFKKYMDKMFFVANKIDFIDKEELLETIPFWESQLKDILHSKNEIKIYPLVAKDALNGNGKDIGFYDFKTALENFLTSDEKAIEIINPPINTVLSIISTFKTNIQLQLDGMKFSPEEFEKKISENMPKLDRIRKRKNELIDYISNKEELLYSKVDVEISTFIDNYLDGMKSAILEWDDSIEQLQTSLPEIIKESLTDNVHTIQEYISEEITDIIDETASRYKDFLEDLGDFQLSFIKSISTQNNLVNSDEFTGYDNFDVGNIALQWGGAFGIGWISGFLLAGPIGWIVGIGGSMLWGGVISEKKRQNQLQKIANDIRSKIEKELKDAVPEIKVKMRETFIDFKGKTANQMNILLQSVEDAIKGIKQNMELEYDKIEQKRNEYRAIQKQFIKQEKVLDGLRIELN
jgi:tRNA U34 5-carboxymethylaminomethyl modifying GTPase MnmE/TrmE